MFALAMVFGLEMTMAAVVTNAGRGVTDRFRSLPMASSAVLLGRSSANMAGAVAGLAVLVSCGLAMGWHAREGLVATLAAIGLLLLLRFALIWVGIYLGLLIKGPEAVTAAQILVWPLGFLSNAFVAPSTMPGWLGMLAGWNPLLATVSATRDLFGKSRLRRPVVARRPRRGTRGGLAAVAARRLPAAVGAPLPPAQPLSCACCPAPDPPRRAPRRAGPGTALRVSHRVPGVHQLTSVAVAVA